MRRQAAQGLAFCFQFCCSPFSNAVAKGEGVEAVEPAVVEVAALSRLADLDHGSLLVDVGAGGLGLRACCSTKSRIAWPTGSDDAMAWNMTEL